MNFFDDKIAERLGGKEFGKIDSQLLLRQMDMKKKKHL